MVSEPDYSQRASSVCISLSTFFIDYSSCLSPCVYSCCCDVVNDGPWVPVMVYSTGTPRLFWKKSVGFLFVLLLMFSAVTLLVGRQEGHLD